MADSANGGGSAKPVILNGFAADQTVLDVEGAMSQAVLDAPSSPQTARLLKPREEAVAFLQNQVKKGAELKALRIRNGQELDSARTRKLEWTNETADVLNALFDSTSVAEQCNDWVGKIYPEYAEFSNFVNQFHEEMDHRLKRVKAVIRQIQKLPSETRATAPAAAAAVPNAPAAPAAPVAAPAPPAPTLLTSSAEVPTVDLNGLLILFGADEASKNAVLMFLESLDVDVALVEEGEGMPSIIESLESDTQAKFAIIVQSDPSKDRAFELGYCIGRMGQKRVCILHPPNVTLGPDPRGLSHALIDPNGGWQLQLARHLRRAGLPIDLNKLG